MKRFALASALILILVTVASAQSGSFVVADVPFSFHVQDNHASAGTYRVGYQGIGNDYLVLTDKSGINVVAGLNFHGRQPESSRVAKLVFHKYGDEYFLVAIRMPYQNTQNVSLGKQSVVTHQIITQGRYEEVTVLAMNK